MTETETSVDSVVLSPMLQKWLDDVTSLWGEIGQRDTRIAELNAQIESERQVDPEVLAELTKRNEALVREVAEHVDNAAKQRTSITDLRSEVSEAIANLAVAQDEARDSAADASAARERITELTGEHEQAIAKLSEDAANELAEERRKAEADRVAAQEKYDKLDVDLNNKLRDQAEEHRADTEAAQNEHDRQTAAAKAAHEAEIDRMSREAADAKASHEAEVARLQQEHRDEVTRMEKDHADLVSRMTAKYEALDKYIPVVAAENQQIGKAKGISVASAYIDAAKSEDADVVRVKKLAASIVPPVALATDPRSIDLEDDFWGPQEPATVAAYVPAPVEGFNDEQPAESPETTSEPEPAQTESAADPQDASEDEPWDSPRDDSEVAEDKSFNEDDHFGSEDEEAVLPDFIPEAPVEEELPTPVIRTPRPEIVDGPVLPPFNPYEDMESDNDSGLPAFNYSPEPESEQQEQSEEPEPNASDEFNSVGNDFAFAKKLQ